LIVLRHSLLTTKEDNRGILGVRGFSTTVTRLPATINGGTGLARKLGLLVGFRATSGEVEVQGLDCC